MLKQNSQEKAQNMETFLKILNQNGGKQRTSAEHRIFAV
jgi:hypothetical protein